MTPFPYFYGTNECLKKNLNELAYKMLYRRKTCNYSNIKETPKNKRTQKRKPTKKKQQKNKKNKPKKKATKNPQKNPKHTIYSN